MSTKQSDLGLLFRSGKLLSYIETLCLELEDCLNNRDYSQLESLLDSVYQDSELLDFCENYSALIPTMDLYRRVFVLKRKLLFQKDITAEIKAGAKTVLESLEHYASPSSPWNFENEELKYMILPWIVQPEPHHEPRAVLRYMYYEPVAVPDDHWLTDQFYSFRDKPQAIEYFESIVDEIKVNLFFQKRAGVRQRVDIPEMRWPHYGIFFDGAVKGKSYGGALLVMMLMGFIETLCGAKDHGFGGYFPASLIEAVIQPDGSVLPTHHLLLKIDAFLQEYGCQHIRIILAEGSQEHLGLKYQQGKFIIKDHCIPGDRIIFVKNTNELCMAAFPKWKELVSWVWQNLADSFQRSLFSGLADEWTPKKIHREFLAAAAPTPAPALLTYSTAPGDNELKTSFHYSNDYDGIFDFRFGFEEGTFLVDPGKDMMNEVVVIAVDGSSFADPLWATGKGKDSKITRTVFEILRTLARKDRTFYLHFLSCREPELLNISRFTNTADINQFLQKRRRALNLLLRGNFIAPVVNYWRTRSLAPHKRIIILSNGPVYDSLDIDLSNIFRDHLWFCFDNSGKKYLPHKHVFALKDINKDVNEKLKVTPRKITRVKLVFENWYPYEWNSPGITLKSHETASGARVFEFESQQGTRSVILNGLFLANTPFSTIDYEIEIKEKNSSNLVSGCLQGTGNPGLRFHSDVIAGQFPEPEWEVWERFSDESGDYTCPVCDSKHERLLKCKSGG
jgi:hypothetical protein